jgi:hypothetical protein
MAVFQLPTANALRLDRDVRNAMGRFAARFPGSRMVESQ